MVILQKDDVIRLHKKIIKETGGVLGIRDEGLLESALAAPFITFDGKDLYPTIIQKAARLGFGIVSNHAFIDGNKRIACHMMLLFLRLNNISLSYSKEDLVNIFFKVSSNHARYEDLLNWINNRLA